MASNSCHAEPTAACHLTYASEQEYSAGSRQCQTRGEVGVVCVCVCGGGGRHLTMHKTQKVG